MVKIRLQRHGARRRAFYRIVAIDERTRRDGRVLEQVGHYDPKVDPPAVKLDLDRVDHWMGEGAQQSPTVRQLVHRARTAAAAAAEGTTDR